MIKEYTYFSGAARFLITAAAFVVLVAGLRAASELVVPFLLAAFIAVLCAPPLFWLRRRGLPDGLAVLVVVLGLVVLVAGVGALAGTSFDNFSQALPDFQARLKERVAHLFDWLERLGMSDPGGALVSYLDLQSAMRFAAGLLKGLGGVLTDGALVLLTVVFILLEAAGFPAKLRHALDNPEAALTPYARFADSVQRYVAIKTSVSMLTGLLAGVWVAVVGVDFPVLWGVLAFLFNYVPTIGSIIAAVPPLLLALVQSGFLEASLVAAGYVAINVVLGNLVEPRFMGRGMGLSTLVVFFSLVFWGWVLGPVGMLLSVPLTMIVKLALETSQTTRPLAILLGPEVGGRRPPPAPREAKA
jgi:AI-2 transport protein TqsA